jgi:TrmH family RNA methyltransferase
MKFIRSKQNETFKFLKSLIEPRTRKKQKAFLLEGATFVRELLQEAENNNWKILYLVLTSEIAETEKGKVFIKKAEELRIPVILLSEELFKIISPSATPQGIIAVIKQKEEEEIEFSSLKKIVLILEALQDPSNVGAIIRVADAAGVSAIFYTKGTTDPYSPKAVRSSAGSILHLPVLQVSSLEDIVFKLKNNNFTILGSVAEGGKNLFEINFPKKIAIIVGNEARGISQQAKKLADLLITIPMFGKAQSLNVAVATGIILYQILSKNS